MDKKEKIKYFLEVVTSHGLIEEVENYISIDCMTRMGEKTFFVGVDGIKAHIQAVRKTYPDLRMKVIRQYMDGNYIISEFIVEGTHKGDWLGMKASGKKLTFSGINIDKIINGKITEHSGAMNTFEVLFEAKIIKPM